MSEQKIISNAEREVSEHTLHRMTGIADAFSRDELPKYILVTPLEGRPGYDIMQLGMKPADDISAAYHLLLIGAHSLEEQLAQAPDEATRKHWLNIAASAHRAIAELNNGPRTPFKQRADA